MIIGVPHRPTRGVSSRFLAIRSVDSPHVSIRPFAPRIVFHYLTENFIVKIPLDLDKVFIDFFDPSVCLKKLIFCAIRFVPMMNSTLKHWKKIYPRYIRIVYVPFLMRMLLLLVAGDSRWHRRRSHATSTKTK